MSELFWWTTVITSGALECRPRGIIGNLRPKFQSAASTHSRVTRCTSTSAMPSVKIRFACAAWPDFSTVAHDWQAWRRRRYPRAASGLPEYLKPPASSDNRVLSIGAVTSTPQRVTDDLASRFMPLRDNNRRLSNSLCKAITNPMALPTVVTHLFVVRRKPFSCCTTTPRRQAALRPPVAPAGIVVSMPDGAPSAPAVAVRITAPERVRQSALRIQNHSPLPRLRRQMVRDGDRMDRSGRRRPRESIALAVKHRVGLDVRRDLWRQPEVAPLAGKPQAVLARLTAQPGSAETVSVGAWQWITSSATHSVRQADRWEGSGNTPRAATPQFSCT